MNIEAPGVWWISAITLPGQGVMFRLIRLRRCSTLTDYQVRCKVLCDSQSLPPPTPSPSPKLGHVLTHTPTPRMHQGVIDGDNGTALGARTSSSTATEVAGLFCLLSAKKLLMEPSSSARDLLCTDRVGSRSAPVSDRLSRTRGAWAEQRAKLGFVSA